MSFDASAVDPGIQSSSAHEDAQLFRKIGWHVMPLLCVCYLISFIDRLNVGMAQLQMKQSLTLSTMAYSIGASVFFVGYSLFEVPSNLMLKKVGVRKTLLRIMVCWGLVCMAMMFVRTAGQYYVLRFLLGSFEAGFFPGIILYLTYWFPAERRARMISIFYFVPSLCWIGVSPLIGMILKYTDGAAGLHGWQWLFLLSGLPAPVFGILSYVLLSDGPEQAQWLTAGEKSRLHHRLINEEPAVARNEHASWVKMSLDPRIYLLALTYFLLLGCAYSLLFWGPTLLRNWGVADIVLIGILAAIPTISGGMGVYLFGRSSDKRHERRWHFAVATVLGALGIGLSILARNNLVLSLSGMTVANLGLAALPPLFFAAVSDYMPKTTAAAGIALISCLGNVGAAVVPPAITWITTVTHGPFAALYTLIAIYVLAAVLLMLTLKPARRGRSNHGFQGQAE